MKRNALVPATRTVTLNGKTFEMREFRCTCGKLLFVELLVTGLIVAKCRCGRTNWIGDLDIGLAPVVE